MPYTLIEKKATGEVTVTDSLESFWLFYNFIIDQATKVIDIRRGFCAVYISKQSGLPNIKSLNDGDSGINNDRKLEIINRGNHKVILNKLRLVDSRFSQFSNEESQLHLFDFSPFNPDKLEWINAQGWSPTFTNSTKNDNHTEFIKQLFSFNDIKDRQIFWLSTQSNSNGTERVTLALPFVSKPLLTNLLSSHNQPCPEIKISVDEKNWTYSKSADPNLPGAVEGFIMVAEGAFKSIALSGEIDDVLKQNSAAVPSEEIMVYLSKIVQNYPTPIKRNLITVANTKSDSVVPSSPQLPIEILYLEHLNSINPVDLIIR